MSECPVRHGQPHTWVTIGGRQTCGLCGAGSRGSHTTVTAPRRLTDGQQEAFDAIAATGPMGLTVGEYARVSGRFPNEISGRFTELKDFGVIRRLPARRGNGAVWVTI